MSHNFFIFYLGFNISLLIIGLRYFDSTSATLMSLACIPFFGMVLILSRIYKPKRLKAIADINSVTFNDFRIGLFYLTLAFVIVVYGAPALQEYTDRAKVIFNSGLGAVIIRVTRYVTYLLSFYFGFAMACKRISMPRFFLFQILGLSVLFLLGYKGDMFSGLIISFLAYATYKEKLRMSSIFFSLSSILLMVIFVLSIKLGISVLELYDFLILRLTVSNAEGLHVLIENRAFLLTFPAADLFAPSFLSKIFGMTSSGVFNAHLMTLAKDGVNPDGMQLATMGLGFSLLYGGFAATSVQLVVTGLAIFYLSRTLGVTAVGMFKALLLIYLSGLYFGQEPLVNFIDFFLSSTLAIIIVRTSGMIAPLQAVK